MTGTASLLSGPGETVSNLVTPTPGLADAARYDYRPTAKSPARQAGIDPGKAGEFSLRPAFEYRHPLQATPHPATRQLDIGALPYAAD